MRVVLDTNILIGALITKGTPPDRLYLVRPGGLILVLSVPWYGILAMAGEHVA